MRKLTMRRWAAQAALLGMAALLLTQPACTWEGGGNFSILGYTTTPNYRTNIKTVRVPIFKNRTYIQRMEFDLTAAICHAIEQQTPYKVVNSITGTEPADTELIGTITNVTKQVTLAGATNEVNQQELDVTVEITWKDLRTGEILSRPGRRPGEAPRPDAPVPPLLPEPTPVGPNATAGTPSTPGVPGGAIIPTMPTLPGTPAMAAAGAYPAPGTPGGIAVQGIVPPVVVKATVTFVGQLGASTASGRAQAYQQLAIDIVSLMEKPW